MGAEERYGGKVIWVVPALDFAEKKESRGEVRHCSSSATVLWTL
ncbi:hypothetical protein A2U01_0113117 [Trifolium medium]|uniref:Uncharacterized protein n=1 Tax=Trifolium medium TaxID=97028 RepID=A0A392VWH5_9FABA|nr:hypothetical protein [Trifolium medium]